VEGVHPFQGVSGGINISKVLEGKYNKLDTLKYSNELKDLIYLLINLVFFFFLYLCISIFVNVWIFVRVHRDMYKGIYIYEYILKI
jgi:hypothetical protein